MTNQWGIELSSNASRDIENEYCYREGESELCSFTTLKKSKKRGELIPVVSQLSIYLF
jgi:hypothetical protein